MSGIPLRCEAPAGRREIGNQALDLDHARLIEVPEMVPRTGTQGVVAPRPAPGPSTLLLGDR
jgi:hypothetical protein